MIRKPAVSGRFYPSDPDELQRTVQGFLETVVPQVDAIGVIVPHAGLMYSGHVAGAVYSRIQLSSCNIILCPNHTGLGPPLSLMKSGTWKTPLGPIEIAEELGAALILADPDLSDDVEAHRFEHAIEVELPFIQYLGGPSVKFVPVTVGTGSLPKLLTLGHAMARVLGQVESKVLVIASSDMNHYESDAVTRIKDRKAIDQIVAMNPEALYDVVRRENISMCGYGPVIAMLTAAKDLGAVKAELVKYATSGDVSLDFDRVVGYAGVVIA